MKRDMDLARQIMLELEQASYDGSSVSINIEGYSDEETNYHIMQLADAGLIEAHSRTRLDRVKVWMPDHLTSEGHDFLEASRNPKAWAQAKQQIQKLGGGVTFDIVKTILSQLLLKQVGL